jgi:hypothetical protein
MEAARQGEERPPWWLSGRAALLVAVLAGATLRLLWVEDMEWKRDEVWSFERTRQVGHGEPLPWMGMPTSYELRHPGGTVWVFVGLSWLFDVQQPTDLGRACQLLNVAALLGLVVFALTGVPREQREPWLWAAALVAVNPLAVLLHRKIWPPSIVPTFSLLLIVCWWYRDRRGGAFAWGAVGALLGFLYPAALFLAAGFALWGLLYDRRRVAWRWWLGGSALGALPLVPWLCYVCGELGANPIGQRRWTHLFEFKFWLRWLTEPFGISLHYALGQDFADFLSYPVLGGQPTYLIGVLHGLIGLAAAGLVGWLGWRLWRQRGRWGALWVGRESQTAFTQNACLWGFGLLFTASLLPIHRHYMVTTFPLMFLWLARAALAHRGALWGGLTSGRTFLVGLWAAQFLVSAGFLAYVHVNQRPIRGDYGLPYGAQRAAQTQR